MKFTDVDDAFILDDMNYSKLIRLSKADLVALLVKQAQEHKESAENAKNNYDTALEKERQNTRFQAKELQASLDREDKLEIERNKLRRQLKNAGKQRKESTGRPPKYTQEQVKCILSLYKEGKSSRAIAENVGLSFNTVARIIKKYDTK